MTSTFLVTLIVDDISPASLTGYAEDIQDSREQDGLPIVSVTPWSHPSQGATLTSDPNAFQ